MELPNVKQALSNGESVFLSIFITTDSDSFSFPFSDAGFDSARTIWNEVSKYVLSEDEDFEDFRIDLVSDDGISDIYIISSNQLTKEQFRKWKTFLGSSND